MSTMAAAAVFMALLAPAPAAAQKFTMKFGTATPRGDQNVWMARFKERVEKRAGGELAIKLFPSSQLGIIPRMIEGMQLGTVEGFIGPPVFVKGVETRYQVVDAPGLFDDMAHAHRALTDPGFRDQYLNLGVKKGIRGIGIYVSNSAAVVSRGRAIRRVADFKGLKIRVLASDMEVEGLKRLGAAPTPMPLMEVLPSLQRGALDGVRSGLVIFVPFKYWTISKNLTETDEAVISVVAFVSELWWKKLPNRLRAIMLEEARKLDDEMFAYSMKQKAMFQGIWKKNGGELIHFSAAEQKKFMATLASVGATVVKRKPELKATYDHLLAAVEKTRK
jgi:TRAP-type C4-dicarboxylate transport system substrate-binding protein